MRKSLSSLVVTLLAISISFAAPQNPSGQTSQPESARQQKTQKEPDADKATSPRRPTRAEREAEARREAQKPDAKKAEEKKPEPLSAPTFSGLKLRHVGPALMSGRVIAFAVDPENRAKYYVAVACGNVWKTVNGGTTFTPIFDDQGSYSIGAIALDPKNPATVWVGTGELNSQRSVGYGDGIYRSEDGGKTWKHMGLKRSEHIARIVIDPRDSNVVYVAAQGPLWGPGGDRGLYKTTDGGKTWNAVLSISENTGVTDVAMDPRDPNVLYAAAYQRRRHVYTMIDGGPEGAIHKSTDGGATWTKLSTGLPKVDLGRIGLAISPANPDVVYATVEAADRQGGIFRSADRGATWERRNEFDQGGQYYGQVVADPKNPDRIYIPHVISRVSEDGGRTLRPMGERWKHVDTHALWIDPDDTDYILAGCDGGIYETFDRAATWNYKSNLSITQFYDVTVDEEAPFYNIYGGTQDNNTLGGPSRTRSASGITNADWYVLIGGDGFHARVDPTNPNIVYAEYQYGNLFRYDRRSGEKIAIQPQPGKGEPPLRWNWDSPLIISPHSHTRLYFAANRLFRSDDRGDSWRPVSGDITRQLDRDKLPIMGKLWGPDAVTKHVSTSFYGNCVALAESPKAEGLLYVGTDDGLINVTENGGGSWTKVEKFPGVPEMTYVSRVLASQHADRTVYASFDNHKNSDFKPYLLRSVDAGKTWTSIAANLPENGPVLAIAEDHVNPNLLFVGTEFGLFFTLDGGKKWVQLKGGLPTIAVRDLAIQKRENDLVLATFGRGFYVLDDYTPLRGVSLEVLAKEAELFPVKNALMYIQSEPLGGSGKGSQGDNYFTADNPPFGAVFTYYLKDELKTRKKKRQDAEKEAEKNKVTLPYPPKEQLRAEAEEEAPTVVLTVTDGSGRVVRRLNGPVTGGINRVAWDLRDPAPYVDFNAPSPADNPFYEPPVGPLVMPGRYSVSIAKIVDGTTTQIAGPQSFEVAIDKAPTLPADDRAALVAFQQKAAKLQRAVTGAVNAANDLKRRIGLIKRALRETPAAPQGLFDGANNFERRLDEVLRELRGDVILAARNENVPLSIADRVGYVADAQRFSTSKPTQTQEDAYVIAAGEFQTALSRLRSLVDSDLVALEKDLENAGAPWTPGRLPTWSNE
jgi:photosystem II stability/assembly factor-like uncharacterized protein